MNPIFKEFRETIREAPFLNSAQMYEVLEKYAPFFEDSNSLEYVKNGIMPMKIANEKLGEDTIAVNVNSPLNCYCGKNEMCEQYHSCYAQKTTRYPNSALFGVASAISFDLLTEEEIIAQLEELIENAEKEIKYIRWNELAEFYSMDCFLKANRIAEHFYKKYGIISYSYTHNRELPVEILTESYIVMTFSYSVPNQKQSIVVDGKDLPKYLNKEEFVICLGNCEGCPYCKDKEDLRTVVFVNHYSKSMKKELKKYLGEHLKLLEAKRFIDNGNFLLRLLSQ